MYHISILTATQKFSLFAQRAYFLYIVFFWKMTSHSDALFSMCKTQAHFIQIILFKISKSATLLSLILIIDSWKASVTTSRSWISESHHSSLISRSLWVQQDHQQSISDHFFLIVFWISSLIAKMYLKVWIVEVMSSRSEFDDVCIIMSDSASAAWWSSRLINVFWADLWYC